METTVPEPLQVEATSVASAYLQILDPDQTMTPGELDAFSVGVQAGITAALDVARRAMVHDLRSALAAARGEVRRG